MEHRISEQWATIPSDIGVQLKLCNLNTFIFELVL